MKTILYLTFNLLGIIYCVWIWTLCAQLSKENEAMANWEVGGGDIFACDDCGPEEEEMIMRLLNGQEVP